MVQVQCQAVKVSNPLAHTHRQHAAPSSPGKQAQRGRRRRPTDYRSRTGYTKAMAEVAAGWGWEWETN